MVLNLIDDKQDVANILSHKIFLKVLKKHLEQINVEIDENKKLTSKVENLEANFKKYLKVEEELLLVLNNMEMEKRKAAHSYLKELKMKDHLQLKLNDVRKNILNRRRNKRAKSSIEIRFKAPLKDFTDLKFASKGITFEFTNMQPIHSTYDGSVVYVGELASYGNVVMIDHGNEIRSVILGEFTPKIKKGKKIRTGDVLGYTKQIKTLLGKVYFEVRKKNKVQNTIMLLDKKTIINNIKI